MNFIIMYSTKDEVKMARLKADSHYEAKEAARDYLHELGDFRKTKEYKLLSVQQFENIPSIDWC